MRLIVNILVMFIFQSVIGQTLDDYLVMAADSNAALKASYYRYYAALEEVDQIGLPDPEIGFGYFISPVETRLGPQQARFSLMQMFPWFGTIDAHKRVKADLAHAKFEEFEAKRNDLYLKIKEDYYTLYKLEEEERLIQEHLNILELYRSLALTKIEAGKSSTIDVLRLDMEVADFENKLVTLSDRMTAVEARFNQYMNRAGNIPVVLPDTMEAIDLTLSSAQVWDSISIGNDELARLESMNKASQESIIAARKRGAPSFGIGMNYILINERTDMSPDYNGRDAFMPMVTMKIPIYRRKYKAQVAEATINQLAISQMKIEKVNHLNTRYEMIMADYRDADRRVTLYKEQIQRAIQAREILVDAYSVSGKDFEEILRIQRMLLEYEKEIIRAIADKNTSVAKIEALY